MPMQDKSEADLLAEIERIASEQETALEDLKTASDELDQSEQVAALLGKLADEVNTNADPK